MRTLKLEVQLSIDGFANNREGNTDWMLWHWQEIALNKENPQQEFANAIINMKRFMFSKKLKKSP